ncbi:hypothetical protein [Tenacibaculum aestuariivivum]|uniref:hypothetical protein n=1 Tax=Tenacibaculum aestuariivivum TaxID=2006131 RepID=UPI003AB908D8
MNKELKNSINFINKKIGTETKFSTPKNYFNEVEKSISSFVNTCNLPKKNNFETPDNYFNSVEKIILEKTKQIKTISLYKNVLQLIPIAVAASVLLFIGLSYINQAKNNYYLNDITQADVLYWYENGYGVTNNDELATVLNDIDFDENILSSINKENMKDYLNTIDDDSLLFNKIQ